MLLVTPEFISDMIRSGPLTEARARALNGSARPRNRAQWEKLSTWSLICEEILDTEHTPDWYDNVVAELERRGFSPARIDRMRRFAWRTAGWLNFDRMFWEWVHLDEEDIKFALGWQLRDGVIDRSKYAEELRLFHELGVAACSLERRTDD